MRQLGEEFNIVVPRDGHEYEAGQAVNLIHEPDADEPWRIEPDRSGDYEVLSCRPIVDRERVRLRKIR